MNIYCFFEKVKNRGEREKFWKYIIYFKVVFIEFIMFKFENYY